MKHPKPTTTVIYYTAQTAPHAPVDELVSEWHPVDCELCRTHAADPTQPECYSATCAACNWDRADVRKLRVAKRRRFEAARFKRMKLSPPAKFRPLFPKGFDPSAVILPDFTPSDPFAGLEYLADGVAVRYLQVMGATSEAKDGIGIWSCGCVLDQWRRAQTPCARHAGAFNGSSEIDFA